MTYRKFKGTNSEYAALHQWVRKHLGKPKKCEVCNTEEDRRYHWANVSNKYLKDLSDWKRMCVPCHAIHDGKTRTHCKRGHELTEDNIYQRKDYRQCHKCRKIDHRLSYLKFKESKS